MTQWLKQSTAATVKMGPFLSSIDGDTEMTGLTIAQASIRLSKNGGAFAQSNNSAGATHDEKAYYGVPLDTTDTGTLGRLKAAVHVATAEAVWQDFMVVPANVWDSMFGGTDLLDVSTVQWTGTAVTAPNTAGTPIVDVTRISGTAVTAASGRMEVNTTHWRGTAVATPAVAGVPSVDSIAVSGTTPSTAANLAAAVRDVDNTTPAASSIGEAINAINTTAETATAIQAGFDNNQAAYANAIWLYVVNGSHTALGVMRGMRAWLFGAKSGAASLTPVFKDPESGTAVITGVAVSVTGDRDASTLNLG